MPSGTGTRFPPNQTGGKPCKEDLHGPACELLSYDHVVVVVYLRAQPQHCHRFREACNQQRPHDALDMQTPAALDEPSPRPMPSKLPPLEYPDRFEVRDVSANGGIRWHRRWVNVSITCAGEYVGLEEIDDGVWNVYFGPLKLGRLLERHRRIEDAYGRLKRHR